MGLAAGLLSGYSLGPQELLESGMMPATELLCFTMESKHSELGAVLRDQQVLLGSLEGDSCES